MYKRQGIFHQRIEFVRLGVFSIRIPEDAGQPAAFFFRAEQDVYKRQVLVQVKLMIYEETFKYLVCDAGGMLAVQGWRYRESQFGRNMFAAGSPCLLYTSRCV